MVAIGRFLLTIELFACNYVSELFFLIALAFVLTIGAFLLTIGASLRTVGMCVCVCPHLNKQKVTKLNCKQQSSNPKTASPILVHELSPRGDVFATLSRPKCYSWVLHKSSAGTAWASHRGNWKALGQHRVTSQSHELWGVQSSLADGQRGGTSLRTSLRWLLDDVVVTRRSDRQKKEQQHSRPIRKLFLDFS